MWMMLHRRTPTIRRDTLNLRNIVALPIRLPASDCRSLFTRGQVVVFPLETAGEESEMPR